MLFLDGVYVDRQGGSARFRWVSSPATQELTQLSQTIARRVENWPKIVSHFHATGVRCGQRLCENTL
jgi:hypothetical protein